jgi:uncharacterized damage-inducible protein DinB
MHDFFRELLEYTFHFNGKVIDVLINNSADFPGKSLELLNHTINAQEIWNARILEQPVTLMPWEIRESSILAEINILNYQTSLKIVDSIGFEKVVDYKNSRNIVYSNNVKDMLFHIVNHSTYHRSQIATDFKLHGLTPLVTDYIFYKRD